jgi:GAF domain-containing protein
MPASARRTATYDASVLEKAERVRTSPAYRRALVDLAGRDPATESALFNELARIALGLIERRALEIGYRQLGSEGADERDTADDFLESQALAGFGYEDDEESTALLDFLSRDRA